MWARLGASLLLLGGAVWAATQAQVGPAFLVAHPWSGKGQWIRADLHMHSRLSDGGLSLPELVDRAREYGCDAVAVADHADRQLRGASDEYMAAVTAARAAHPEMVIVAGLEWNVPPWGGDEHAGVLVPDGIDEAGVLKEFKRRWDDFDLAGAPKPEAAQALAWLSAAVPPPAPRPVVIYNHPSRPDASSLENVDDIVRWRAVNDLVIGFEAGPGHQGATPPSSYSYKERPIDRWDPVAARPGDAWDRLLQRGLNVHAALSSSDFHNANPKDLNDYWPCQFSETWIYVPERTVGGVLRAMRAGSFFGEHGRIAREAALSVSAPGLPRPAFPGEHIRVRGGAPVTATLSVQVPQTDWEGKPNALDQVEFIVITPTETTVQTRALPATGEMVVSVTIPIGTRGAVVRARGRRVIADGPDFLFYTNAIRVSVAQ